MFHLLLTFFLCLLCFSALPSDVDITACQKELKSHGHKLQSPLPIKHAKHFKVITYKKFKLLVVDSQVDRNNIYLLTEEPKKTKHLCKNIPHIKTPIKKMVSLSTSHLPALDLLNQHSALKGFGGLKYISSEKFTELAKRDAIVDVHYPPNTELVLSTKPDIVMVSDPIAPTIEGIDKMLRLNLPVIFNADFKEPTPLARAEWIKFVALFFNQDTQAIKLFNEIEKNYLTLKTKVMKTSSKPLVITGSNHQGVWQSSGGQSNFAKLLADAGARYAWANNKSTVTISTNIEKIFQQMEKADFWLPQNNWKDLQEITKADSRNSNFPVFKNKKIFNNNLAINRFGGNDYWETGLMRPDKLLADLVKILHPELLPKHQLIWYQKLN